MSLKKLQTFILGLTLFIPLAEATERYLYSPGGIRSTDDFSVASPSNWSNQLGNTIPNNPPNANFLNNKIVHPLGANTVLTISPTISVIEVGLAGYSSHVDIPNRALPLTLNVSNNFFDQEIIDAYNNSLSSVGNNSSPELMISDQNTNTTLNVKGNFKLDVDAVRTARTISIDDNFILTVPYPSNNTQAASDLFTYPLLNAGGGGQNGGLYLGATDTGQMHVIPLVLNNDLRLNLERDRVNDSSIVQILNVDLNGHNLIIDGNHQNASFNGYSGGFRQLARTTGNGTIILDNARLEVQGHSDNSNGNLEEINNVITGTGRLDFTTYNQSGYAGANRIATFNVMPNFTGNLQFFTGYGGIRSLLIFAEDGGELAPTMNISAILGQDNHRGLVIIDDNKEIIFNSNTIFGDVLVSLRNNSTLGIKGPVRFENNSHITADNNNVFIKLYDGSSLFMPEGFILLPRNLSIIVEGNSTYHMTTLQRESERGNALGPNIQATYKSIIIGDGNMQVNVDPTQLNNLDYVLQLDELKMQSLNSKISFNYINNGANLVINSPIIAEIPDAGTVDFCKMAGNGFTTPELSIIRNVGSNTNHIDKIIIPEGSALELSGGSVYVNEIQMLGTSSSSSLNLKEDSANYFFTTNNESGKGKILIDADNMNLKTGSRLGSNTALLESVTLNGDHKLKLENDVEIHALEIKADAANNGLLTLKGDVVINANINNLRKIVCNQDDSTVEFTKPIIINNNIVLSNNNTLKLGGNVTGNEIRARNIGDIFDIQFTNENLSLQNLNIAVAGARSLIVDAGADANFPRSINVTGQIDIGAGSSAQIADDFNASLGINFVDNASRLSVVAATNQDLSLGGFNPATNGVGILDLTNLAADNVVTVTGDAGSNNNHFNSVIIPDDVTLKLNGAGYIDNLTMQGAALGSKLELAGNGQNYLLNLTTVTNESGQLLVTANNATILSGSNIGTADNKLKDLTLSNGTTLSIGDLVNLYLSANTISGAGTLNYNGSSIVTGGINGCDAINLLGASGSVVDFQESVIITGNATLNNGNRAKFGNNVSASQINSSPASIGIIEFDNTANSVISAAIGLTTPLRAEISGADTNFTGSSFNSNNSITFTNTTLPSTSTINASDLGPMAANVTTLSNRVHSIDFVGDLTLNNELGSSAFKFDKLRFTADETINLGASLFATIEPSAAGTGTVNITAPDISICGIGLDNLPVKLVDIQQNTTLAAGNYANKFEVASGTQASFIDGNVKGAIELQGVGSSVSFNNVPLLDSAITTTTPNQNSVEFNRNIVIEQDVGTLAAPLARVDFNSELGDRHVLKGNVYAGEVAVNNTTLVIDGGSVTFNAPLITENSILIIEGNTTMINQQSSSLDNTDIQVSNTPDGSGNIVLNSCDIIQTGGSITVIDTAPLPDSNGDKITIFNPQGEACLHSDGTATINDNRRFVEYEITEDSTAVTRKNIATQIITEIIDVARRDGQDIVTTLKKISSISNPDNKRGVLNELEKVSDVSDSKLVQFVNTLSSEPEINDPLAFIPALERRTEAYAARAAGDEEEKKIEYSAWIKPYYNSSTLKKHDNIAGYSATGFGVTAGIDQRFLDNLVIGLSLSIGRTDVKHKDFKSGDKTRLDNTALSIYGLYEYNPQISINAIGSYSNNNVKSAEHHNPVLGTVAKSSYSFGTNYGEIIAGYSYNLKNGLTLKPLLGASYQYGGDYSYKQVGSNNTNKSVKRSASYNGELITGVRLAGNTTLKELPLNLSAYAMVKQSVLSDSRRNIDVQFDGLVQPMPPTKSKIQKTNYAAGIELNTEINDVECGFFYDAFLAPNFQLHQGSLKFTARMEI